MNRLLTALLMLCSCAATSVAKDDDIINSRITADWSEDKYLYFKTEEKDGSSIWWYADTKDFRKKQLIDNNSFASQMNKLGVKVDSSSIFFFDLEIGKKSFEFNRSDKRYSYDFSNGTVSHIGEATKSKHAYIDTRKAPYWQDWSADSLYYVCTKGHNVWLFSKKSDNTLDSLQLTTDGVRFNSYSMSGNNDRNDLSSDNYSSPKGGWIGETHSYLIFREDKVNVKTMTIVNSLDQPRPTAETYKFAMPGDEFVPQQHLYMINAEQHSIFKLDQAEKFKDQKVETPRFGKFIQTENYAYFIRRNRQCDTVELCRIDSQNGDVKTLICENCAPRLNEQLFGYHVINDGKEIIWWSERSGKGHHYLYDGEGNLLGDITRDDFVAGNIVKIDTLGQNIIYEGFGREAGINPHYKLFYKSSFNGKKLASKKSNIVLLTPGNGDHEISFSPEGKYISDIYSRMDMAGVSGVYDLNGNLKIALGTADPEAKLATGWKFPQVMEVMSADGKTPLYGVVYTPADMDSSKTYPIISNPYPGPHTDLVPQSFSMDDNGNQTLADKGFVVINFSYRGSCPYRGHDYYNYGEGNLRDYAIDDDMATIRQVAQRIPQVDTTRVGIYGHSGGGFMTVAAMLEHPEFYKVGVAASGNHDNNIYTQWWGETFHGGHWETDSKGHSKFVCKIPTNIELADKLEGKLMLITGDVDNNVHPANTLRLVKALMNANKDFDMMVFPGVDHGIGGKYYDRLVHNYFVKNL